MNNYKYAYVLILYWCFSANMFCQSTDSIIRSCRMKNGEYKTDSLLVKAKMMMFSNPDKSYELIQKLILLSKKQKKPLDLADSYRLLGSYYSDIKAEYKTASDYYYTADNLYRQSKGRKASEGIGAIFHCFGTLEQHQGNYLGAIQQYTQALHVFDSINNLTIRPKTLNNLSTLYSFLKDQEKSEKYARECLMLSEKNKDEYLISVSSVTLASSLIAQKKYNEIISLLNNAKSIALSRKDNYILDLVYLNYGSYFQCYKKDYTKAIGYYLKSSLYADSLGNDYERMRSLANLSESYLLNNQYLQAERNADKAYSFGEKLGSNDMKYRLLTVLAKTEAHKMNFEKAYQHLLLSSELKDSVIMATNQQQINYLEAQYQSEKKELQINTLLKQKKLYSIITFSFISTILLILLTIFLRYKITKRNKQITEQKVVQLEQEKQIIATQAVLDGENAERTRLARDLHDGLGGMLSAIKLNLFDIKKDVIIETDDVSRFNKVIEMLDNSIQELRRVAHNMMPESLSRYGLKVALEDFCNSFSNVKFHFFGNEKRIEKTLETTIYRAVHELVNNAVKHSEADVVNVQLVQKEDVVSINVQDDGKGFDTDEKITGNGIQNIQNRVNSIGGIVNIFSSLNSGTEINIDINIPKENEKN